MNSKSKKLPNTKLRSERELRGWSQEDLAEKVGTTQKIVSRWERGESTPLPYYRAKLCTLFSKNAQELGFLDQASDENCVAKNIIEFDAISSASYHETQLSATNIASQPIRQDSLLVLLTDEEKKLLTSLLALDGDLLIGTVEDSSIERSRRAFLRQLLTLLGASFALPIDQLRPAEPDTSIISDDLISFFENTMTAHWELYHTGGAIRVVQGLDSWVKEITRLSRLAQGSSWQPRILRLLTMSYQLQSCVLRDIMDYQQAHIAYQRAFHVAQELDDAELMAAALAREGVTFIQQDKPKQAVIYLDGALTTIERHIGQAETIQEQQVQEHSLLRFNKASLAAQKGVNAVLLEDYQQAIKLLDASLVIYDPALIRGRARLLAQKAEAYYGLGAIEACTASANEALALGRSAGSNKTIARVRTLYDHLLQSSWRKEPSVTQLGETLARA
jgi:transcriptional regulator with XRE-family HTH domain